MDPKTSLIPLKTEGEPWAEQGEFTTGGLKYQGRDIHLLTEVIDYDEDVIKMGHTIIDANTKERLVDIDWSPYSQLTQTDLALFIELGCPNRTKSGPLNRKDLDYLKQKRAVENQIGQLGAQLPMEI